MHVAVPFLILRLLRLPCNYLCHNILKRGSEKKSSTFLVPFLLQLQNCTSLQRHKTKSFKLLCWAKRPIKRARSRFLPLGREWKKVAAAYKIKKTPYFMTSHKFFMNLSPLPTSHPFSSASLSFLAFLQLSMNLNLHIRYHQRASARSVPEKRRLSCVNDSLNGVKIHEEGDD